MPTKQKKTQKKSNIKQRKSFFKHPVLLSILMVIVIGLGVLRTAQVIHHRHAVSQDKAILWAAQSMLSDLQKQYSNKSRVTQSKPYTVCYNADQGPFDNGRLYCEVGIQGVVDGIDERNAPNIMDSFRDELEAVVNHNKSRFGSDIVQTYPQNAFKTEQTPYGIDQSYYVQSGIITCSIVARQGGGEYVLPRVSQEQIAYKIDCTRHTSERYYRYDSKI